MTIVKEVKDSLSKLINELSNDELLNELFYMLNIARNINLMCNECRLCSNYSKSKKKRLLSGETYNIALNGIMLANMNSEYRNIYLYLKETEDYHFNPSKENCMKNYKMINELRSAFEDIFLNKEFKIEEKFKDYFR